MKGKEAATADTFDEDEYRDKLIGEGYSDESARTLAAKKKESFSASKIEIDLGSLAKVDNGDEEFEHLSPEERKKRQKDKDKRQAERAAHRAVRQKQHDEVEAGIPEGK